MSSDKSRFDMPAKKRAELRAEVGAADQAYQAAVDDFDAAAAAALGVNRTDLRCLEILHQQATALPSQLGARLRLTTGSVTPMLDRLERIGYITRESDRTDRRKTVVRMTPKARKAVWDEIYRPLVEEGFAGIEHYSTADLTAVLDYLRRGRNLYERHLSRLRPTLK
jgi:DNA-binding MarR family transcriptional regulator